MALFRCGSGSGGSVNIHTETFSSLDASTTKTYTAPSAPKFVYFCGGKSGSSFRLYEAVYDESVSTTQYTFRYYHGSSYNNGVGGLANLGTVNTYPPTIDISGNTVTLKTGTSANSCGYTLTVIY